MTILQILFAARWIHFAALFILFGCPLSFLVVRGANKTDAEWIGNVLHRLLPIVTAAAAISGETRCVRPPRPWRPSKLRFDVLAQRSPGLRMSGFMPRHMLQPASRHSKPASLKTRSRPSFSASSLTNWEPGTTIACTDGATRRPLTMPAAACRSETRELVH